jgi:hypothetical protein
LTEQQGPVLQLDDIQVPALRERSLPHVGTYFIVRIDDPTDGREMLRRLAPRVASAAHGQHLADKASINVALTFQGLKRLV